MARIESKELVFSERILEVLESMAEQWPSISITIDAWRLAVVSQPPTQFMNEAVEQPIRLGENIPAFYLQTVDRWYQEGVGIIRQNADWVIVAGGYDIKTNDYVEVAGEAHLVVESAEQAGVAKLKIDKVKSRFVRPARTDPTYRQMTMKAHIV